MATGSEDIQGHAARHALVTPALTQVAGADIETTNTRIPPGATPVSGADALIAGCSKSCLACLVIR